MGAEHRPGLKNEIILIFKTYIHNKYDSEMKKRARMLHEAYYESLVILDEPLASAIALLGDIGKNNSTSEKNFSQPSKEEVAKMMSSLEE